MEFDSAYAWPGLGDGFQKDNAEKTTLYYAHSLKVYLI